MDNRQDIKAQMEGLIFASPDPLTVEKIYEILQHFHFGLKKHEVKEALAQLKDDWSQTNRPLGQGISLREVSGGFIFTSHQNHAKVIQKFVEEKPVKIAKSHFEALCIIAYRQPIIRVDVDEIRGVDSSFAIKKLMELNLVKILGKSEGLGRPLLYGTTKYFLEFFGLNSLNDLPSLEEYESLGEANKEKSTDSQRTVMDLFDNKNKAPMFSEKTLEMTEEALKSLDEALLQSAKIAPKSSLKKSNEKVGNSHERENSKSTSPG